MTKFGTAGLALAGILAVTAASVSDASAQWRGHRGHHHGGWGPGIGIGAGIAAGALIGSAVAARPYYGGGYYYDEPVYAQPYGYAEPYAYDAGPTYYRGSYGRNYCNEGYRRVPCTQGGGF